MSISLVAIVWDGPGGILWIEGSDYNSDIHELYIESDLEPPDFDPSLEVPPPALESEGASTVDIADEKSDINITPKTTRKKPAVNVEES